MIEMPPGPTEELMADLTPRMRWAFAARCARRVLALTGLAWPVPEQLLLAEAVDAVAFAERPHDHVGPCGNIFEPAEQFAVAALTKAFQLSDPVQRCATLAAANAAATISLGMNLSYCCATLAFARDALRAAQIPAVNTLHNPRWPVRRDFVGYAPGIVAGINADFEKLAAVVRVKKPGWIEVFQPEFFGTLEVQSI